MGYAHRLEGKRRIKLADFDPGEDAGLTREEAEQKTALIIEELVELQELLYAVPVAKRAGRSARARYQRQRWDDPPCGRSVEFAELHSSVI